MAAEVRRAAAVRWKRRLGSVRVRTTLAAVVVVGIALVVGSVALVATLRSALTDDLRIAALLRAEQLAAGIVIGDESVLEIGEADEEFVQVIDAAGRVVAASDNVSEDAVLASSAPLDLGTTVVFDPGIGDEDFVVAAASIDPSPDRGPFTRAVTVVYGQSLDEVGDSANALGGLLAIAGPLLVVVVGATTWFVVGRALAPVESMRVEVDAISGAVKDHRIAVPATGDEIARLASTMNDMLDRIESGHARQRRFVADASHELRSPIASLRQHAEVAHAHPDWASLDELAATALEESDRLQRLVDDLLLLARADEGALAAVAELVDVDDAVFAEAERLRHRVDLQVRTREVSAGRVRATEDGIARILRNLADNAARHATGTVVFALRQHGDEVELVVEDDGPGIPVAERTRVFERFIRLDEARTRDAGGSGLGLSIVAELVVAFGGTVSVGEGPLGGARVVVRLPASED